MKFKKLLALILTLLMIVSLVGCLNQEIIIDGVKDKFNQAIENAGDGIANAIGNALNPSKGNDSIENEKLSITMLDVGQGLSVLIESNGEYMLYDGGGRNYSSYVVSYLQQHNITRLKYMFASHYDEDHINGLVGVLNTTKVDTVVNPDYETDTKIYQSYKEKLTTNGAEVKYPSVGDVFTLGNATITVLSPIKKYEDFNSCSIVVKVQCEDFSCIITGDAEKDAEANMLQNNIELDTDLYIVGHHGSSSSSTDAFVQAMSPVCAFISVGADNSYGHPHDETMNTLEKYNIPVYRTDTNGEVECATDGKEYKIIKQK